MVMQWLALSLSSHSPKMCTLGSMATMHWPQQWVWLVISVYVTLWPGYQSRMRPAFVQRRWRAASIYTSFGSCLSVSVRRNFSPLQQPIVFFNKQKNTFKHTMSVHSLRTITWTDTAPQGRKIKCQGNKWWTSWELADNTLFVYRTVT